MSGGGEQRRAPEEVRKEHDVAALQCGEPALDDWLRRRRCSMRNAGPHACTLCARTTDVLSMHGVVAI